MAASVSAAFQIDTVVIGAGVIGLAVARSLALTQQPQPHEILLLDRASRIGSETSSRNSEVLHAGIYYPCGSRKATWCVQGQKMLYEYCREKHVPHRQVGKLIVATTPNPNAASNRSTTIMTANQNVREQQQEQLDTLQRLYRQADSNGVNTELLSREKTLAMEPSLSSNVQGALWSPTTGIVDSHSLMVQLLADAQDQGNTTLSLRTPVQDAEILCNNSEPRIHLFAGDMWLSCRNVINCAGVWADHVARMFHKPTNSSGSWTPPRQYYAKGNYFRCDSHQHAPHFAHLIYPVPDPRGGLGVHATLDLQGNVKFGPDVEWVSPNVHRPDEISLTPDPSRANSFVESIRTYYSGSSQLSLVPDYCGIRPKLHHPSWVAVRPNNDKHHPSQPPKETSMPFQDFLIVGPETHGVSGLIHLFGMESPGLTCCLAIAEHVQNMLLLQN